ncbi:MAG: hypothetical protein PCFJNLEI_00127 [Verrucomicrobiae bacterium]|nr:hypothetical protein [Verrucomicrobiae bacterium]
MKSRLVFLLTGTLLVAGTSFATVSNQSSTTSFAHRWQTDLPSFQPDLSYPILYTLTLQGISIGVLASVDRDTTGFTGPSGGNFQDAWTRGPSPDDDDWYWNYTAHPIAGSEFYLRARAQGYSPLGSFVFSGLASAFWEFGVESWYQRPSSQDLIITPLAGLVLGEARFRAKRALLEADTTLSRAVAVAIDPLQSFTEIIGGIFGRDWREPAFRQVQVHANRSEPLFTMGMGSTGGRPGFAFQCRIPF